MKKNYTKTEIEMKKMKHEIKNYKMKQEAVQVEEVGSSVKDSESEKDISEVGEKEPTSAT